MAYWIRSKPYEVDKPIVAFADNVSVPYSVMLSANGLAANYHDFTPSDHKKTYPAGLFIYRESDGTHRFLPFVKVVEQVSASSGTYVFKVTNGYVLTWAKDHNKKFALVPINSEEDHSKKPASEVPLLTLTNLDHFNHNFTFTHDTSSAAMPTTIPENTYALKLYQGFDSSNILGVYEHAVDFTYAPTANIAVVSKAAGVYKDNLPYTDAFIEEYFRSTLNIRDMF